MKNLSVRFILFLFIFFFYSCEKKNKNEIISPSVELFFDIENIKSIEVLKQRNFALKSETTLINDVIKNLKEIPSKYRLSESFLKEHGYPIWKLSNIFDGPKEQRVVTPIFRENSKFVEKILLASKLATSTQWKFKVLEIQNFTNEISNPANSKAENSTENYISFQFMYFNEVVFGSKLPCDFKQNFENINNQHFEVLKKAKTSCYAITSYNGYCYYGGTAENPYLYFNGCEITTSTIWICEDFNPDAYWAHHQSTELPGGQPAPPMPEPYLVTHEYNPQIEVLRLDCHTFNFQSRGVPNAQESAIKGQLKFGSTINGETRFIIVQIPYLNFHAPSVTYQGRIISSGEAANAAAKAWRTAMAEANSTFIYEQSHLSDIALSTEVRKTFINTLNYEFKNNIGSNSAFVNRAYPTGTQIEVRPLEFALPWENPYDC